MAHEVILVGVELQKKDRDQDSNKEKACLRPNEPTRVTDDDRGKFGQHPR